MDKNTVIGFILIAAVLIGFTYLNKPSEEELKKQEEKRRLQQVEYAQNQEESGNIATTATAEDDKVTNHVDDFFATPLVTDSTANLTVDTISTGIAEKTVTLENSKLKIGISTKGGMPTMAEIKGYNRFDQTPLMLFDGDDATMDLLLTNKSNQIIRTGNLSFEALPTKDKNSLIMRFAYTPQQYVDFIYQLPEDDYMLKFDIRMVGMQQILNEATLNNFQLHLSQTMRRLETNKEGEQRYSSLYYKYINEDVNELDAAKGESLEIKEPTKWIAFKNQFFANVFIANDKIELAVLDSKILDSEDYIKQTSATLYTPVNRSADGNTMHAGFSYYIGPMSYSLLEKYDENVESAQQLNLDELVPMGWMLFRVVNKYFVVPLFNLLKSSGLSMGLVILLLTIIVKLIISPLTYKSFMSSAKMRVLRPQVEALNEKYPKKEQAQEKQQAVMALYNRAGANPMAGCVPMLLQMPILIALFQFFPNAIDLRHQSFLWAPDLSTYDAIWYFPTGIPFVGGMHLSLFCILMTITNIVYTKFNMDATNTGQQQMPGMKWMMYLMPLIFFFVLNSFPSGLTYYYFLSLLITILLTLAFRFLIDEDKVLAKLEANKAKPKKKKGFMARLEEAQRQQQKQLDAQKKKK